MQLRIYRSGQCHSSCHPRPYKFFNLYCRLIFREYSRKTVYIYTNNLMSLLSFRTYRGEEACPSRRPVYLHFHKHRQPVLSLAPHYPKSKSTASGGHHNYSLFIIHHSLFIKQKVRAFSDNGPRYKISM